MPASNTNVDTVANELNSVSLETVPVSQLSRPTRTRRQRLRDEEPTVQVKWYQPTAICIFNALYELEKQTLETAGPMYHYIATHLLVCRIYYAVLFHIRLLVARQQADLSSDDENFAIKEFNEKYHIESLPMHEELVDHFRDTFPSRAPSHGTCGIAPSSPEFPSFEFKHIEGSMVLTNCQIPHSHAAQPSPKLGLHLLRWYKWKLNQDNDEELPDSTQRLSFIALGYQDNGSTTNMNTSIDRKHTLQQLFSNPLFLRPLPIRGGFNIELLRGISRFDDPPIVISPRRSASRKFELLSELLTDSGMIWFNQLKYIVSSVCSFSKGLSLFSEVNLSYRNDELDYSLEFLEQQSVGTNIDGYINFGNWMNVFTASADEDLSAQNF